MRTCYDTYSLEYGLIETAINLYNERDTLGKLTIEGNYLLGNLYIV